MRGNDAGPAPPFSCLLERNAPISGVSGLNFGGVRVDPMFGVIERRSTRLLMCCGRTTDPLEFALLWTLETPLWLGDASPF